MPRDRIPQRYRAVAQRFSSGNRVELLRDGLAAFPAMLDAIKNAKEQVLLEMYWFDSDRIGREFAAELVAAAARGLEVGVLYDAFGSIGTDPVMFAELRAAGAKVVEFGPIAPWRQRFRLGRLTRRDHRKLLLVDGELGFTGGLNIADAWRSVDETGGGGWRDDVVRVEGPAVRELLEVLLEAWQQAGGTPFQRCRSGSSRRPGDQDVAVLGQSFLRAKREISRAYVAQLYHAKRRAYIRNAYFVPDRGVRRALKQAAERGVDVRVLMPGTSDVEIVRHASRATWGTLLRSGVRLFEWQGGILHAKSAVVNGRWSTVGTYNLDYLSLRSNLEVNVSILNDEFGAAMEQSFLEDLRGSIEIDAHAFRFRPLGERLLELIAYRFRKILVMPESFEVRTHASLRELGEAAYRALLGPETPPFLRFEWLDALERTGCVVPKRGWLPMHLGFYAEGELVAAAPAYVKGNSEGEFVFDHSWAHFSEGTLGVRYYPKLIVAVPFTPATGPRLLMRPDAPRARLFEVFSRALGTICNTADLSGAHVLFPSAEEASQFAAQGLLERHGLQYQWHNPGYASFDEFLARFSAKRRHQIRYERRALAERGVELEVLSDRTLGPEQADFIHDFYAATVDKFAWGRRYLNRSFFEEVCATMPEALHVVVAREGGKGRRLGGAFNLLGPTRLYGRYWGALAEVPFLHFNVCFYRGIEEAIVRKLTGFEPGAGGEHKLTRGFEPTITHSAHLLVDRRLHAAVADHLGRERQVIDEHVDEAAPILKPEP